MTKIYVGSKACPVRAEAYTNATQNATQDSHFFNVGFIRPISLGRQGLRVE